ncbi:MAG TPA: hypothetical protein VM536_06405 [Chloroflexia bacterium]|nr:hypothetical protein [Chloroflexia bacterium]
MRRKRELPEPIVRVRGLALLGGLLAICSGLGMVGFGGLADVLGSGVTPNKAQLVTTYYSFGVLALALGIASVIVALGLTAMQRWAWALGVALYCGISLLPVVLLAMGSVAPGWPPIMLMAYGALVLFYLLRPDVRRALGSAGARGS